MKITRIAMLSLAVVLYGMAALAQHGNSGAAGGAAGGGTGMGAAMGHGSRPDNHGNPGNANAGGSGSTQKMSVSDILL